MFQVLTLDEYGLWDKIVKSFSEYDVYYLSSYVKSFSLAGDGTPLLFYYNDGENMIRAINVVMYRDISENKFLKNEIPKGTYYDISTPYGYGGFLIQGDVNNSKLDRLIEHYENKCLELKIVSEIVRFHPVIENIDYLNNFYLKSGVGATITIDTADIDRIWDNFNPKNRNVIRKSISNGVRIFWGRSDALFLEFEKLYKDTMDRDNASEYYYFNNEFFKSINNDLKYNSLIFYAMYNETIISMAIILFCNNTTHYHLSSSKFEYRHLAPTNHLLYEAACWSSVNGYSSLHLGGGFGGESSSLYKFKKSFNRNSNTFFSIGKKIFNNEIYDYLVDIRKQSNEFDIESSFFPAYRAN